ncbi:MAG: PVC-type heme-binding CxxCH protein [Pirellulales bacterium]
MELNLTWRFGASCRVIAWASVLCWLISGANLWAQRELQEIPDPDPELERTSFELAPGFEVNLYAADPLLAKPIQMNFDHLGRLWIASSSVYPQIKPGETANDKVIVLSDDNRDGRADTTTVFEDGLLIPTAVLPSGRGAYVANSTELLYLEDTDGDGRSDRRQVVLSGFGTEDTHHILHTFRWGPDLRMYMNQSIYIHSHIETPWGVRRMNGGGIWDFQPRSLRLQTFALGLVNPWGTAWDDYGQTFATDGAGGDGINFIFPGFVGVTSPGARRVLNGLNPGKPKLCGLELLGGEHLPPEWRGNLIANDFRAHRVCRYEVRDDGSGFSARELDELIKTRHVAFRPIDVKQGPDGAIYIADWYNPIIQHGEVDFRDPRRDHVHGRIWRVTYRDRAVVPVEPVVDRSNEELLEWLKSEERWRREQAKLALGNRGQAVVEPVRAWWRALPAELTQSRYRLEALWLLTSLEHDDSELYDSLLSDTDFRVRAGATRVVGQRLEDLPNGLQRLATLVRDEHPRVRLEAVRALSGSSDPAACGLALEVLDQPMDRFLEFALWRTVNDLQDIWVPALERGHWDLAQRLDHWIYALQAVDRADVVPMLVKMLDGPKLDAAARRSLLVTLSRLAAPDQLAPVWQQLTSQDSAGDVKLAVLTELLKRPSVGDIDWSKWTALIEGADESLQVAALQGIGQWHGAPMLPIVRRLAQESDSQLVRRAAIAALGRVGSEQDQNWLREFAASDAGAELRGAAVVALSDHDLPAAAKLAVQWLGDQSIDTDSQDLVLGLIRHRDGARRLSDALADQQIRQDAARLALRALESTGRQEPGLAAALSTAGRLDQPRKHWTAAQREAFLRSVLEEGDPGVGESIFRRTAMNCLKCHAIGSAGGAVGPELASVGASAPVDYLLDSLLDPNRKIKENYHSQIVVTKDGQILGGIKLRQSQSALILRNAENQVVEVPLDDIDEQQDGGSLMPAGLTDALTDTELRDLVRFLSELGKSGPYALPTQRYLRSWETAGASPADVAAVARLGVEFLMANPDQLVWLPLAARVNGEVPVDELARVQVRPGEPAWSFLRSSVDVSESVRVKLQLVGADAGLRFWLDGNPISAADLQARELSAGSHTLQVVIDRSQRRGDLQVKVVE